MESPMAASNNPAPAVAERILGTAPPSLVGKGRAPLVEACTMMMKDGIRILLVEDDRENCRMLEEALRNWGYTVTSVLSGHDALAACQAQEFDLVLTDIRLGDVGGLEILRAFRQRQPRTLVIMMTGFGSVDTAVDSVKAGAFDYVSKPFKLDEIRLLLERAGEQLQEKGRGQAAAAPADTEVMLLGHSRAMAEVYKQIARVAAGKTTVLIRGESGTGKELVARAIHQHSDRAGRAFVAINCAALPDALLESELFGYSRGAHSTATADKPGVFELAAGGTLLLDEVGDMSFPLQAKFLRVLEDTETRRLGDTRAIRTDVRVIAATNKPLEKLVKDEQFRSDLFYRLNVVSLTLPALRDRLEDIPVLVEHFVRRACAAQKKPAMAVAPETLAKLQAHGWPGNVRELENVIERAVLMTGRSRILPEDLPDAILSSKAPRATMSLEAMEREHIIQALAETRGNVKAAAAALGIDRKTLYRKTAEYGIEIVRE